MTGALRLSGTTTDSDVASRGGGNSVNAIRMVRGFRKDSGGMNAVTAEDLGPKGDRTLGETEGKVK